MNYPCFQHLARRRAHLGSEQWCLQSLTVAYAFLTMMRHMEWQAGQLSSAGIICTICRANSAVRQA